MKKLIIIFVLCLFTAPMIYSWDATTLDTIDVQYSDGKLKEKYQTLYWGGRDETTKYGFYRSWYTNGQLESEGQYKANKKIGTWISWDSLGSRIEEISYKNGKKNGQNIEWNPDGTFRKELYWQNDTLHGLCTWKKPGIIINAVYNNLHLAIDSQFFYFQGIVLIIFKDQENDHCWSYKSSNFPKYNEKLDLWFGWNSNKTYISVGKKVNDLKEGSWISWSRSGVMKNVEFYKNGELINSD